MKNLMIRNGQLQYGDQFHSLFNELLSDPWMQKNNAIRTSFQLDLKQDESGYTIDADIPGVAKENVKIELVDDQMTISVEKNEEIKEEKDQYIHRERRSIASKRAIFLPDSDPEGVVAKLVDGVLTVTVPKIKKEELSRKIEIQ